MRALDRIGDRALGGHDIADALHRCADFVPMMEFGLSANAIARACAELASSMSWLSGPPTTVGILAFGYAFAQNELRVKSAGFAIYRSSAPTISTCGLQRN